MQSLRTDRFLAGPLALLCAAVCAGCATPPKLLTDVSVPLTGLSLPVPNFLFFVQRDTDLTGERWTDAFGQLHEQLAREYPYTEWKQIDWAALEAEFGPQIAAAETAQDRAAFYRALRAYVYAIPDAHLGITREEELRRQAVGGGLGFSLVQLDDGTVVSLAVKAGGPAEAAGMKPGAAILEWNERPIEEALRDAPVLWGREPPGQGKTRRFTELRMLGRAAPGAVSPIVFRNPDDPVVYTTTITAAEDAYESSNLLRPFDVELGEFDPPLTSSILPDGIGYIRVYALSPTLKTPFPDRAFSAIIAEMLENSVKGIVIDLRGNTGGTDQLVPAFAGHFVDHEDFYEDVAVYDARGRQFRIDPKLRLSVSPVTPHFGGAVVALVDHVTMGPAEGLAMLLQRLPQGQVLGFSRTRGAAGVTGGSINLPEGITIFYPNGRSLDATGAIQLERNAVDDGGVVPDVRPPLDGDTARRMYQDKNDVLLEKAISLLQASDAGR